MFTKSLTQIKSAWSTSTANAANYASPFIGGYKRGARAGTRHKSGGGVIGGMRGAVRAGYKYRPIGTLGLIGAGVGAVGGGAYGALSSDTSFLGGMAGGAALGGAGLAGSPYAYAGFNVLKKKWAK